MISNLGSFQQVVLFLCREAKDTLLFSISQTPNLTHVTDECEPCIYAFLFWISITLQQTREETNAWRIARSVSKGLSYIISTHAPLLCESQTLEPHYPAPYPGFTTNGLCVLGQVTKALCASEFSAVKCDNHQ